MYQEGVYKDTLDCIDRYPIYEISDYIHDYKVGNIEEAYDVCFALGVIEHIDKRKCCWTIAVGH